MLVTFKGEMTLDEILNTPKKLLTSIRDARKERLEEEERYAREAQSKAESQNIQNQILTP